MGFRDYLRLFRAQTGSATVLLVMVAFLVGGGKLFSGLGLCLLVFAMFLHWFSFGHNSLIDFAMGYDTKDVNKVHHPLVNGSIKLDTAHNVIHTGLLLLGVMGCLFVLYSNGNQSMAMVCFCLFLVAGHCYNDGMSKSTVFGFVPITISFVALSLFGYYVVATKLSWLMFWVAVYFGLTLLFQISYSGHLKEIEAGGANLLRKLGASVDGGYFVPGGAPLYGWMAKYANLLVGWYIFVEFAPCTVVGIVLLLFTVVLLYELVELTRHRLWDRNKSLRDMSFMEVLTIYLVVVVLLPVIGYVEGIVLMVGGVVYFVVMNKINWGTLFRPQV